MKVTEPDVATWSMTLDVVEVVIIDPASQYFGGKAAIHFSEEGEPTLYTTDHRILLPGEEAGLVALAESFRELERRKRERGEV